MTPPEDLKACFQGAGRVALRFSEPPVTSTTTGRYEAKAVMVLSVILKTAQLFTCFTHSYTLLQGFASKEKGREMSLPCEVHNLQF